jgi:hypothetical protein
MFILMVWSKTEAQLYFQTDETNPGASMVTHDKTNETLRVVSLDGMAKELGW